MRKGSLLEMSSSFSPPVDGRRPGLRIIVWLMLALLWNVGRPDFLLDSRKRQHLIEVASLINANQAKPDRVDYFGVRILK